MAKKSFFSKLMGSEIIEEEQEMQVSNFSFADEAPEYEKPYSFGPEVEEEDEEDQTWTPEHESHLMVDVYQTKDDVIIQSVTPGVHAEDVDITIANDKVTIEGERKRSQEVNEEDYFYQECYWGPFSRSIVLPVDVDMDNVEAKIKDGILTIILPKAAKAKVKKIQVKA